MRSRPTVTTPRYHTRPDLDTWPEVTPTFTRRMETRLPVFSAVPHLRTFKAHIFLYVQFILYLMIVWFCTNVHTSSNIHVSKCKKIIRTRAVIGYNRSCLILEMAVTRVCRRTAKVSGSPCARETRKSISVRVVNVGPLSGRVSKTSKNVVYPHHKRDARLQHSRSYLVFLT